MARENFSIGAFYNITKNQDNPIKTVGRDSFLSTKTPKNTSFSGSPSPQGSHSPYILGDTTSPRHITYVLEIGSKTTEKNSAQTNKETNQQTLREPMNTQNSYEYLSTMNTLPRIRYFGIRYSFNAHFL